MDYSSISNILPNKIYEIDTNSNHVKKNNSLGMKYVRIGGEAPAQAAKKPEKKLSKENIPASAVPAPAGPVPQNNAAAHAVEDGSFNLDMTNQGLLNSFILSEVFGRPKCFRPYRRPAGR